MKPQAKYIAKEAFPFSLFCFVCLVFNTYWGCTDGWLVGAIIGISFFGIVVLCYRQIYSLRAQLPENRCDGIEIKDWKKITILIV